jgi:hypothetical protein
MTESFEQSREGARLYDRRMLSQVREPILTIVCPCGRRVRYGVLRLRGKYGDISLKDLLQLLARCKNAASFNLHEQCRVGFEAGSRGPAQSARVAMEPASIVLRGKTLGTAEVSASGR